VPGPTRVSSIPSLAFDIRSSQSMEIALRVVGMVTQEADRRLLSARGLRLRLQFTTQYSPLGITPALC